MSTDNIDTIGEDIQELVEQDFDAMPTEEFHDSDLDLAEQLAQQRYDEARTTLVQAWQELDLEVAERALRNLYGWRVCLQRLRQTRSDTQTVHIDSLVLADCYQSLFVNPDIETIVYLTGIDIGANDTTANRRIHIEHESQSAFEATGHPDASFDTLRELDRSGHRLVAHCHNHPNTQDQAPMPSQDDRDYQDWLEGGGYEAIGLIMSQDGYVRLYTNDLDINVKIHGNHVKRLDESRIRLEEPARNASTRIEDA